MKKALLNRIVVAAFSSILSGAVLGLLFAPEKGTDTRKRLSRKGDEYLHKIKSDLERLRSRLSEQVEAAKNEVNDLQGK